jgi:ribokinase
MALITVDATGENEIVVVAGANGATDARRVRAASAIVREADVVVAQAEIPSEAIAEVVDLGARVFVLNLAPFVEIPRDVLARVDVLVVNATEAGQVLGTPPPSSVEEALGAVRDLAGSARNAVITLGADGAVLAGAALGDEGHSAAGSVDAAPGGAAPAGVTAAHAADVRAARHVPVPEAVPVVDATGAGDAFVGVLAACLAKDMALDEAVASGVAAATRTVQVVGAAHAYPDFAALLRERTTVAGSADGAAGAISTAGPAAIGDRSGTQS